MGEMRELCVHEGREEPGRKGAEDREVWVSDGENREEVIVWKLQSLTVLLGSY